MGTEFFKKNRNRFEYASWVNLEKNFFYVETPKVACSTIKVALQRISGLPLPKNLMSIHYRNPKNLFVHNIFHYEAEITKILSSNNVFKFCFVRNPVSRLESAFKDKILNSRGSFWEKYRRDIRDMFSLSLNDEIDFECFVSYVKSLDDDKRDIHWRSQYSLLRPDIIPYDFIGKQENFAESFAYALGRIGVSEPFSYLDMKVNSSPNIQKNKNDVAEQLKDEIREIYAKDVEVFGY